MRIQFRPWTMGGRTLSAKSLLLAGAALTVIGGTTPSDGQTAWGETNMYNFKGYPKDGDRPEVYGNLAGGYNSLLYGTTILGGKSANCTGGGEAGCGAVFTVDTNPDVHHHYPENILYSFSGTDGQGPSGTLWFDISNHNNIWGTTIGGGKFGTGTVFELTLNNKGKYTEHFLYSFGDNGGGANDGAYPLAGVVQDGNGNVYGTTSSGGQQGSAGAIFEIDGGGNEYLLHSMNGTTDGYGLYAGLVIDGNGNLYGVAQSGGNMKACNGSGCGTVFEVANGGTFSVIYRFKGGLDGASPVGGLTIDARGNLFGTTQYGGDYGGGTIFEITRGGKYNQLYPNFGANDHPASTMWLDASGHLFGSAPSGGNGGGYGYAFEYDPRSGNFTDLYDWALPSNGTTLTNPTGGPIVLNNIYYFAGNGSNGQTVCDSPPSACGVVVKLTPP